MVSPLERRLTPRGSIRLAKKDARAETLTLDGVPGRRSIGGLPGRICRRHGSTGQSSAESDRGHDQPAVPEQHDAQRRAGEADAERARHPAGDTDQAQRRLEPDFANDPAGHFAAGIRARAGAGQRHRRHSGGTVLLARQAREADLGPRTHPAAPDQFERRAGHEEMGHRPGCRVAHERRPLAIWCGGQQHLVLRRAGRCRADQPDARPVLRQLQLLGRAGTRPPRRTSRPTGRLRTTIAGRYRLAVASARSSRSAIRR